MNTDLIQSITQQAAVIIVNTIFFSERISTGLCRDDKE